MIFQRCLVAFSALTSFLAGPNERPDESYKKYSRCFIMFALLLRSHAKIQIRLEGKGAALKLPSVSLGCLKAGIQGSEREIKPSCDPQKHSVLTEAVLLCHPVVIEVIQHSFSAHYRWCLRIWQHQGTWEDFWQQDLVLLSSTGVFQIYNGFFAAGEVGLIWFINPNQSWGFQMGWSDKVVLFRDVPGCLSKLPMDCDMGIFLLPGKVLC